MYYPSSENKGADQLRGYREADLRLCFRLGKNPVFSRCGSYRETKDDPQLSVESVDKCVESIKTLEHWIKGNKRSILYYSALQGEAIDNLKKLRRGDTGVFLVQQGVPCSVSHCNALIRLYRLIKDYPQLQNCSIEVGIVLKNMKVIREICKELAW